jgi:hypothetical protein
MGMRRRVIASVVSVIAATAATFVPVLTANAGLPTGYDLSGPDTAHQGQAIQLVAQQNGEAQCPGPGTWTLNWTYTDEAQNPQEGSDSGQTSQDGSTFTANETVPNDAQIGQDVVYSGSVQCAAPPAAHPHNAATPHGRVGATVLTNSWSVRVTPKPTPSPTPSPTPTGDGYTLTGPEQGWPGETIHLHGTRNDGVTCPGPGTWTLHWHYVKKDGGDGSGSDSGTTSDDGSSFKATETIPDDAQIETAVTYDATVDCASAGATATSHSVGSAQQAAAADESASPWEVNVIPVPHVGRAVTAPVATPVNGNSSFAG